MGTWNQQYRSDTNARSKDKIPKTSGEDDGLIQLNVYKDYDLIKNFFLKSNILILYFII